MSVWLTLDNVTERSSALCVHSARRPLCLRQSKLGEILQTSAIQSLFVLIVQWKVFQHCNKNDFLGTCEFLWYKPGAGYSSILQASWSVAFPLWSKHQMAAVLQNLQWTVLVCNLCYLVLGTWYLVLLQNLQRKVLVRNPWWLSGAWDLPGICFSPVSWSVRGKCSRCFNIPQSLTASLDHVGVTYPSSVTQSSLKFRWQ